MKSEFKLNVLAIRRNGKYFTDIKPDMTIETDDMLYLFGSPEKVAEVNRYFIT